MIQQDKIGKSSSSEFVPWYEQDVRGMEVEELEQYLAALVELKRKALVRACDLSNMKNASMFPLGLSTYWNNLPNTFHNAPLNMQVFGDGAKFKSNMMIGPTNGLDFGDGNNHKNGHLTLEETELLVDLKARVKVAAGNRILLARCGGLACCRKLLKPDEGCTPKDLWKVCNDYGIVVDVFIPNKKSKAGKPFAFVRFIKDHVGSYVNMVNGSSTAAVPGPYISFASALVLDDSCVFERDLSKYDMGNVKNVNSTTNLRTLLMDEGFFDVKLKYLGGKWVMFELDKVDTKVNMMQHTRVKSWFHVIQDVVHDFVSDERIVWVDNEGIPLNFWSRETFMRIGVAGACDGTIYMESNFLAHKEMVYASKDESIHSAKKIPAHSSFSEEVSGEDSESDVKEVSETIFGDNFSSPNNNSNEIGKQHSEVPFKIYDILKKQTGGETREVSSSLSHPPGFTPEVSEIQKENDQGAEEFLSLVNAKVMNNSQEVYQEINRESVDLHVVKEGGSILGVLEDLIRVGQAMSEAVGNSGGILYVWEANVFKKDYATISDNCVAIYGTWLPSNSKILFVAIYAPHKASCKRVLWEYVSNLIGRWNEETIILGDFNEVCSIDERRGSCFNPSSARVFDHFISSSGLVDVKLEGYAFTWSHPSGSKMSNLDRFLVSECIFSIFPSITALCLDRHLSDHRPILLREVYSEFGLIPFRFYHSWFSLEGFDAMVEQTWRSFCHSDVNKMIRFKKKLQDLKAIIRCWVKDKRMHRRLELQRMLHDINQMEAKDSFQKSKIKWAIEGDENSKFFHGIINKKRSQLAICRVFYNGLLCTDLGKAVEYFFETGLFSKECNSSFVDLILKVTDAKFVNDFRPISLIGIVYKVFTKILANRLALVIADLVFDTQSAFVANRLDGPFIINEILHWCKRKKKQAMFFKVDFAKVYDSVRWDYLLDVLEAFGFGQTWCKWIRVDEGLFKGVYLQGSISISHLFYADDAMFIREWSDANLKGCDVMHNQFRYLGVMVKTLSVGGRLTLLKSVLGASPLYNMSIFKVPKGILKSMEAIHSNFFNGIDSTVKKIMWAAWDKILASKKNGGLGVSSFHALNRALLLKWVWRFISQDGSLWFRVIQALYGPSIVSHPVNLSSNWCFTVRELHLLTDKGFDFLSHCKKRIEDGNETCFWYDKWISNKSLQDFFLCLFVLELDKEVFVADKMKAV
nr:RNA-directed DNA polymerase, eukaryota [Tanacetum cinerariifolium]